MNFNRSDIKKLKASFLIADLAGYTSLTETHGDFLAVKTVYRYIDIINSSISPGSKLIERIGDEVLIMSLKPADLLQTALNLLNAIENEKDFPSIHIGLHFGKILIRDGKFFGTTLNLTSRISSHSEGGQILCSGEFRNHIRQVDEFEFIKLGKVRFKNFSKPVEVFEVKIRINDFQLVIDPVCKMQVNKRESLLKESFGNTIFYFCSTECFKLFLDSPENFVENINQDETI